MNFGSTKNHRIVVCTPEPTSGAAAYVFSLVQALISQGIQVCLFCPPNFEYATEITKSGGHIYHAAVREVEASNSILHLLRRNLIFMAQSAARQWRLTQSGDIFHFQFPQYFPAGLIPFLLALVKRCPIVFTVHDPVPHKWILPSCLRFIEEGSLRVAYGISSKLIVHNEVSKQILISRFRQQPAKIVTIPHGTFANESGAHKWPAAEALRLLAFGSIRENKGLHLSIKAIQQINASGGTRVSLTISGAVANAREQGYWNHCKDLIAAAPAGIKVLEGYVSPAEVGHLVADHHALILPYLEFLSDSGVATLALSNGRPILATTSGGLGPLLAESRAGIRIDAPSVEAISEAICKALELGPEGLRRLGRCGEDWIMADRSWDKIACRTASLYQTL